MTKDKKPKDRTRRFKLTRSEIEKLYQISQHFKNTNLFTIEQNSSSGIGITSTVKFDLFDNNDTIIDITDVTSW